MIVAFSDASQKMFLFIFLLLLSLGRLEKKASCCPAFFFLLFYVLRQALTKLCRLTVTLFVA